MEFDLTGCTVKQIEQAGELLQPALHGEMEQKDDDIEQWEFYN